jgi:predicted transcriptional regulator of viral defense system
MIAMIEEPIQNLIPSVEFDYQTLLDVLAAYSRPRDKISDLMRKGVVVRVKKGLYVLGKGYRRRPYSRELLANLIYGPSYISLESALQYHGLIPERVEALTSVTTGRSRKFDTPVGRFVYREIPLRAYRIGMTRVDVQDQPAFLIATPEKALADKIRDDRGAGMRSLKQMAVYLFENLRLDEDALAGMAPEAIAEIARRYRSRKVTLLAELVRKQRRGGRRE